MTNKAPAATIKVDFSVKLKNLQGVDLTIDGNEGTLQFVCVSALLASYADDAQATGDQKFARYALAKKIQAGASELSSVDLDAIKHYVGKGFPAVVVGPAFEALDQAQPAKEYFLIAPDDHEAHLALAKPPQEPRTARQQRKEKKA